MGVQDWFRREPSWLVSFNLTAVASVLLPLLIWILALVFGGGGDGDDNNNNGWWWNKNNNNDDENDEEENNNFWWFWGGGERQREEGGGQGSLILCYLWSLVVLFGIVLYTNRVTNDKPGQSLKEVVATLVIFSNLALLLALLVGGLGVRVEGREVEESGWMGQFAACMLLTYVFWIVWGVAFSLMVFFRKDNADAKELVVCGTSYTRQDDDHADAPSSIV